MISAYGKTLEDKSRHTSVKVCTTTEQVRKSVVKPTFLDDTDFIDENGVLNAVEIVTKKTKVTDTSPINLGTAILQWSKIIFCR